MSWFVYILESQKDGDFYKGITENIQRRLDEHNKGLSRFTSSKSPWHLVYSKECESKHEALIEERRLKKLNRYSLEMLIRKA